MTGYTDLIELASRTDDFMERFDGEWFLMRVTRSVVPPDDSAADSFGFKTVVGASAALESIRWDSPLAAISKRPGNPFPDRVSIGRAPNCDVVLRLPFVSKLHAHVIKDGTERMLQDNGSSRGTLLNGRRLLAHEPAPLTLDDEVTFGVQPTRVIDAARALGMLKRRSVNPRDR
jgi:hypothetical protein